MEGLFLLVGAVLVAAVGVGLGILVAPAIDRLARGAVDDPADGPGDSSDADRADRGGDDEDDRVDRGGDGDDDRNDGSHDGREGDDGR